MKVKKHSSRKKRKGKDPNFKGIRPEDLIDMKHILDIAHDDGAEIRFLTWSYFNGLDNNSSNLIIFRDVDICNEEDFKRGCENISERLSEFGFHNPKFSYGNIKDRNRAMYINFPLFNTFRLPYFIVSLYNRYYNMFPNKEVKKFELKVNIPYSKANILRNMIDGCFIKNKMFSPTTGYLPTETGLQGFGRELRR